MEGWPADFLIKGLDIYRMSIYNLYIDSLYNTVNGELKGAGKWIRIWYREVWGC